MQINCMAPGAASQITDEILRASDRAGWQEAEEARNIRMTGGITADQQIKLALFLASQRSNPHQRPADSRA